MTGTNFLDTAATVAHLKAIADERRLDILALLAAGERCVCELQDRLDASQSLLSHHLRILREAGIVTDRRDGRWVYYSLARESLEPIEAVIRALRLSEPGPWRTDRTCD